MNIIVASGWGYPYKIHASNIKSEFLARGLQEAGDNVLFMDALWGTIDIKKVTYGVSETGVKYVSFPRYCGAFSVIPNIFNAIKVLRKHKKDKDGNVFISMFFFPIFPIELFISFITSYKRAMLYHELGQCIGRGFILSRVYGYLYDNYVPKKVHVIHPISHYLADRVEQYKKSVFIIPVLSTYDISYNVYVAKQFTYCVSASYLLRNTFILSAFAKVRSSYRDVKLVLVVNQIGDMLDDIYNALKVYGIENNTEVKMNLSQSALYETFASSLGLIIPLDPNSFQDKARFSQKIAEYVSTKRPIITSSVGEIPYYFEDKKSAVIAEYSSNGYADAMEYLIKNSIDADKIGLNGYFVGEKHFNYKTIGKKLAKFYKSI